MQKYKQILENEKIKPEQNRNKSHTKPNFFRKIDIF
jgi:hypothetical protein